MARVLVLFHSRTGNTAALADAVADGARAVRFTEVDVRRLDDLAADAAAEASPDLSASRGRPSRRYPTLDDASAVADYDALILGSPARHGIMAAEMARFLDRLGPLGATGALVDKVGAAFTSAPTAHGGHELTLLSMLTPMGHLGLLLVPPGPTDPATSAAAAGPHVATATAGTGAPTDAALAAARHLGARVARVAGWVRHAKGHEAADAGGGHHHHH